jgi:hypothetical protein
MEKKLSNEELFNALEQYRIDNGIHPDDFHDMFIHELTDKLQES